MVNYYFEDRTFSIEGFDKAASFSSFLPGLVGVKGIPLWVFYVNRGQGVCSFGAGDKNTPITEFSPANAAYKQVAVQGFRTFIRIGGREGLYEPFQSFREDAAARRTMRIRPNELELVELHEEQGLEVKVTYFIMPGERFGALVRQVEVHNRSDRELALEILDGLPEIVPAGIDNHTYKNQSNVLRGWMDVANLENGVPFFKVRSSIRDEAEVDEVSRGHFYLAFHEKGEIVTPLVDAELVFGSNTALAYPEGFLRRSLGELAASPQITANKVPCSFAGYEAVLAPGAAYELYALAGHVADIAAINARKAELADPGYIRAKRLEAQALEEALTGEIRTRTAHPLFDAYCRQNYLDNVLRGGYPLLLDNGREGVVYHVYSRKHGDLEREYNFFRLAPEYYSQGNGNFRDMNQNRRNDVFFQPGAGAFNAYMFFSLIQADGYNPLQVEGCTFRVPEEGRGELRAWLDAAMDGYAPELAAICAEGYTPGRILHVLEDRGVKLSVPEDEFLAGLLSRSEQQFQASFGEGYWSDHWTYNMDLVDNFLSVFPDQKEELLFRPGTCTFFDSPVRVLPRRDKYVLKEGVVRQYGAVVPDEEKQARLGMKPGKAAWLRTGHGSGPVYRTTLFGKMLALAVNKFGSLDPEGMGVEMEANKPGWCDALNGLPGQMGSGMSETLELKRILSFMRRAAGEKEGTVALPEELADYLDGVERLLEEAGGRGGLDSFGYWDRAASLREEYRERIRFGISGRERELSLGELEAVLAAMLAKVEEGIAKAVRLGNGLVPTYFVFEAAEFAPVLEADGSPSFSPYGLPRAQVAAFRVRPLPFFLEGPARWLKTMGKGPQALEVYRRVKETELYDAGLGMYKTSVSLEEESHEIGRIRAFTPGWQERESVFLHMSYKYLLAVLKAGLYEEFFRDLETSLVPFMDPAVYGRSTLENSSFIASSVNPDPFVRGRGFVARLSGSTAEFLSMWVYMMAGPGPFHMEDGQLIFRLAPRLPGRLFDEAGEVAFTLLGKTAVTYRNPRKASTFGEGGAKVVSLALTDAEGQTLRVQGDTLAGEKARSVREGRFVSIAAELG